MLLRLSILTVLLCITTQLALAQKSIGIFAGNTDVGDPSKKGSVVYDDTQQRYVIEGAGTNMWTNHDEFQFVWQRISGDFIATSRASFIGKGVERSEEHTSELQSR